ARGRADPFTIEDFPGLVAGDFAGDPHDPPIL
ncbi:unnamed protein product, partial [marine sediment metagenome]